MMGIYKNNSGFTLVETMVAVVISALVIAAASATYIAQSRSYSAQEGVSEVNTQAKFAHDLIARTIKAAPFTFTPSDEGVPAIMFPGFSSADIITPTDGGGGTTTSGMDAITITTAEPVGEIWPTGTLGTVQNCDGTDDPSADPGDVSVDFNPNPDAPVQLMPGPGAYVLLGGKEFVEVLTYTPPVITFLTPLGKQHELSDSNGDTICDTGRIIYRLVDTTFCVDTDNNLRRIRLGSIANTCGGTPPGDTNEIIAENIDDLQFAYAIDSIPRDGIIDGTTVDILDDPDFMSVVPPVNYSSIRAVRINILARSEREDANFAGQGNPPGVIENNVLAPTSDGFKRRWFQSIVMIRNLEGVL